MCFVKVLKSIDDFTFANASLLVNYFGPKTPWLKVFKVVFDKVDDQLIKRVYGLPKLLSYHPSDGFKYKNYII